MEKMKFETKDLTKENIRRIAELFPEVLTETKDEKGTIKQVIDFDKLRQVLGDFSVENEETYDFTWVGKRSAMKETFSPIRKTLRPCKEESVNWDTTQNLYIEGDNLDVLKLLQESYLGKVKMIYIDPPYNTGGDFVYKDDRTMSVEEYESESGYIDEDGKRLVKNLSTSGRFHSDWCSMMYPRLRIARDLLADDGVIFISIDDNEVDNLRKICDEVFYNNNFVGLVARKTKSFDRDKSNKAFQQLFDYLVVYTKNSGSFSMVQDITGEKVYPFKDDIGEYKLNPLQNRGPHGYRDLRPKTYYPIYLLKSGTLTTDENCKEEIQTVFLPEKIGQRDGRWSWQKSKVDNENNRIVIKNDRLFIKIYKDPNADLKKYVSKRNIIEDFSNSSGTMILTKLGLQDVFTNPKPVDLVVWCEQLFKDNDFIVLDFFAGSSTTAHAVMKLNAEDGGNRKFIMVQLPEKCDEKSTAYQLGYKNISEIGKERIRRAAKQIKEDHPDSNFDGGFRVFKVSDSNMKDVYYNPAEYTQDLLDQMTDNIKEDRTDIDLLYGCMLEWGLPLSYSHTSEKIDNFTVHNVNEGDLIACFDKNITDKVINYIANKKPIRAVFRDASFSDSTNKINIGEHFKLLSPNTEIKVI